MILFSFLLFSSASGQLNIQSFWGEGLLLVWFSYIYMSLMLQDQIFNRFIYIKQQPGDSENAYSCTINCARSN